MRNFFRNCGRRLGRYTLISALTGLLDYTIAFILLHNEFSPHASLGASIVIAGAIDYLALERWGFHNRKGEFSWRRLAGSGGVEIGTFVLRLAIILLWRRITRITVFNNLLGLALAYCLAFLFGYFARTRFVFKKTS